MWMPTRTQVNTDAGRQDDASRVNAMRMPVDTDELRHDADASRQDDASWWAKAKKVGRSMPCEQAV
jgi:hypothetical protein